MRHRGEGRCARGEQRAAAGAQSRRCAPLNGGADTGLVVQRLAYSAYGQVTQDTNPGLQPFGFKGAFSDPVAAGAGLIWMGVRAYQPSAARFTTPDPVGLAAGWNQHDGLGGDPINLIDADGRVFAVVALPAAAAAAGAAAAIIGKVAVATAATIGAIWALDQLIDACTGGGSGNDDTAQEAAEDVAEEAAEQADPPWDGFPDSPPGPPYVWKGPPGKGAWHNPKTGESWRPDMSHPAPVGPHWDHKLGKGRAPSERVFPDGSRQPKRKR